MRYGTGMVISVMLFAGCGPTGAAPVETQMVYVDTADHRVLLMPQQPTTPAVSPVTGKRTLVPGLYCAECRRWYASPPPEVLQRSTAAYRCPRGGHPMRPDGPPPDTE